MNTPGTLVALLVLGTLSAVRAAAGSRRRSTVHGRLGPALTRTHGGGVGPGPGRWADSVPPLWLGARLEQAGLTVGAATVWRWWLAGAGALTLVGLWVGGPAAGLVGAGASATGPMVAWRLLRHGGHRALEAALPAAVDEVARGLRSGASLRQALAEAGRATPGPLGLDLSQV
ncbi:MAG: hypothetical protein M3N68_14830, partial [Actinomycetota bacterium]|nr:hypothetical protein [Actinomycetota bacterium]